MRIIEKEIPRWFNVGFTSLGCVLIVILFWGYLAFDQYFFFVSSYLNSSTKTHIKIKGPYSDSLENNFKKNKSS